MRQLELQHGSKKIKINLPENWNELSRKQLLRGMAILFTATDPARLHLQLLRILGLPKSWLLALDAWQVVELKTLTSFFLENNTLTSQLLPAIRLPFLKGFRRFVGPKERFRNLLFLEFIFADTYYLHWLQTQNDELLLKLVATLYRPQTWFHFFKKRQPTYSGDARQEFNEHLVADRAAKMKHLPLPVKMAIATWYRGCRNQMEQDYPNVFSSENQEEAKGKGGWEPVFRNMAGGKFGDINQTRNANLHTVLAEMDEKIQQARDQEARSKSTI
jgi:hypothetical protein